MASRRIRSTATRVLAVLGFMLPVSCLIGPENPAGPCGDVGCDDGNPCTDDVCAEDGFCDHTESEAGPDDGNECTVDSCAGGEESHTAKGDGAECGLNGGLECDEGLCKCETKDQCGLDTVCVAFSCDGGACVSTNAPDDTPVDGAGDDDCKQHVCDGGEIVLVPDLQDFAPDPTPEDCKRNDCSEEGPVVVAAPEDAPLDDGNPCTVEACEGTTPVTHEPVDDDTPCGPAKSCGPAGGGFETLPQPVCAAGTCGMPAAISCGLYACDAANTDCRLTCSADAHCIDTAFCSGTTCAPKHPDGDACSGNNQCENGHCVDGVCCNAECGGTCFACDLNGLAGLCLPVAAGMDPDNECAGGLGCNGLGGCQKPNGDMCFGDGECQTGFCEDGVCCNNGCDGSCRRCDLGGSVGTCANVGAGQQVGQCSDNNEQCDGQGNCKVTNGSPCVDGSGCLSGFCSSEPNAQDVCCDQPCDGVCESCRNDKSGGPTGTCTNIPDKQDPDFECPNQCQSNGSGCCNNDNTCQN